MSKPPGLQAELHQHVGDYTSEINRLSLEKWGDPQHCCSRGHSNNLELFGEGQPLGTIFRKMKVSALSNKVLHGPRFLHGSDVWCLTSTDPTSLLTPKGGSLLPEHSPTKAPGEWRDHLAMKLVQKSLWRLWKQQSGQKSHAIAYDEFPSNKTQELLGQKGNFPLCCEVEVYKQKRKQVRNHCQVSQVNWLKITHCLLPPA